MALRSLVITAFALFAVGVAAAKGHSSKEEPASGEQVMSRFQPANMYGEQRVTTKEEPAYGAPQETSKEEPASGEQHMASRVQPAYVEQQVTSEEKPAYSDHQDQETSKEEPKEEPAYGEHQVASMAEAETSSSQQMALDAAKHMMEYQDDNLDHHLTLEEFEGQQTSDDQDVDVDQAERDAMKKENDEKFRKADLDRDMMLSIEELQALNMPSEEDQ